MTTPARKNLFGAILLAALTVAAYSPALKGAFIWDDVEYIAKNHLLSEPGGLRKIWTTTETIQYYPMVFTSFWVERKLWGLDTRGYHAVNIALHTANALLVWLLLSRLGAAGAWWIALIFALHPVNAESVAWIVERKNLLSGFFLLSSAVCLLEFERTKRTAPYAIGLLLYAFALLSKTAIAAFPLALIALRWMRKRPLDMEFILRLAPLFLMSALTGLVTIFFERKAGALGPEWSLSIWQRILLAGRVSWFYASKLIWPSNLTFIYPRWRLDASDPGQWVPLAAGAAVLALLRNRREALLPVSWFLTMLLPVMGFINFYPMRFSFVADHFQYLPSLGVIALVVGAVCRARPRSAAAGLGAASLLLGGLTWSRAHAYEDSHTLWSDTAARNPTAWLALNNLAAEELTRGDFQKALADSREALRLRPDYPEALYNLGAAYEGLEDWEQASRRFERCLRLDPRNVRARNRWGIAAARLGRPREALAAFGKAASIDPADFYSRYNLAAALYSAGRFSEALPHCREAMRLSPDDPATSRTCVEIERRLSSKTKTSRSPRPPGSHRPR